MNDLQNVEPTISSREIAEITGKRHDNILRDCDVLNENYEKLSLLKIEESTYQSENGQVYRQYLLTRMQTLALMIGYKIDLRLKVLERWKQVEGELKEAVRLLKEKPAVDFSDPTKVSRLAQR